MTDSEAHAQTITINAQLEEIFPPHPPRKDTPEYRATHKHLVDVLDTPCEVCGVRNSTLADPTKNPFKATAVETHHYPIQREYYDACDWQRVAIDFGKYVVDQDSFKKFVDSPFNMKVLCSDCHRSPKRGIHHLLTSDWIIERYLLPGYTLIDLKQNAQTDVTLDSAVVDKAVPMDERG